MKSTRWIAAIRSPFARPISRIGRIGLSIIAISYFSITTLNFSSGAAAQCPGCVPEGTNINTWLADAAHNNQAILQPNTTYYLTEAIYLRSGTEIYTYGSPTDGSRALLKVNVDSYLHNNPYARFGDIDNNGRRLELTAVIWALSQDNIKVHHLQIDGGRQSYGFVQPGPGRALIDLGGIAVNQQIYNVKAYDPRSWSTIRVFEGGAAIRTATPISTIPTPGIAVVQGPIFMTMNWGLQGFMPTASGPMASRWPVKTARS